MNDNNEDKDLLNELSNNEEGDITYFERFEIPREINPYDIKHANNRFVIGDIHGNAKALKQVLNQFLHMVEPYDEIIFLGDYVDRYPETKKVLDIIKTLIELGMIRKFRVILLRGNHDQWFIDYAKSLKNPSERFRFYTKWQENGGKETLDSFEGDDCDVIDYAKWLEEKTMLFYTAKGTSVFADHNYHSLYVHGGFTNIRGHKKEENKTNFMWDRSLWKLANLCAKFRINADFKLPIKLCNYGSIVIGHSATLYYGVDHPIIRCNVLNMDSGAGFSEGRLSCIELSTFKLFQSDKSKDLYPAHNPKCVTFPKS